MLNSQFSKSKVQFFVEIDTNKEFSQEEREGAVNIAPTHYSGINSSMNVGTQHNFF